MTYQMGNAVLELAAAPGTGNLTMAGAVPGYFTFDSKCPTNGDTIDAVIAGPVSGGSGREVVRLTRVSAGVYSRGTPESSTNGGSAVNFTGAVEVWNDFPASLINKIEPQAGILQVNSTTQIGFYPKNGDRVRIAGRDYAIPYTGVLAANTGVFVNGGAGANLVSNTAYLVGIFDNAGVPTLDFFTSLSHQPDTTPGNVGVEIATGSTPSRTVVGMIRTNGSAQFVDSVTGRFCLSWFNRRLKTGVFAPGNQSTTSTTHIALGATLTALNWGDERVHAILLGQYGTNAAGGFGDIYVGIDGVNQFSDLTYVFGTVGANGQSVTGGGWDAPAEGPHTYGACGSAASGAGTVTLANSNVRVTTMG